jgi:hypothetical protein
MTDQLTIIGRVTRIGYYRDTLPKLVITIRKEAASGIQINDGERRQVTLSINDETYLTGIRTTSL